MGRRATRTEPELLGAAMGVFRRKGFAHTSVRDLEGATGLHPGSLYKAYGSKEGLFAATVTRYNEQVVAQRVRTHLDAADPPLPGLQAFFTSTFDGGEQLNPGCLLTTTAVETPVLPDTARSGVATGLELIEDGFRRLLERAREAGDISPTAETDQLASQLLALYQGVLVLVRFGTPAAKLATVVEHAIPAITTFDHRSEGPR